METFCTRLLVGLESNNPDPLMLRYASMIARLNNTDEPVSSLGDGQMQDKTIFLNRDADWPQSSDAEVRFACLRTSRAADERPTLRTGLRRQLRDQVSTYFTGFPARVPVGWDILNGNAVERLKELASDFESDLLLVGHSPAISRMSTRLALEAPCPVWLVPPDWAPVLRHCLVPVDFSNTSAECFRAAIDLARRSGAMRCVALHVVPTKMIRGDTSLDAKLLRQLQRKAETFLSDIDCRGIRVDILIEEGPSVAQVVSRVAIQHAMDLVVMTARRRTRLAGLILTSQTAQAIHDCPASFLVMKPSARPLGLFSALRERISSADEIQFG